MTDEIINRVAQSKLITFDLEEYYPEGDRVVLDIKDWLYEGLILKEGEFREFANNHDWEQYNDTYVAVNCSTDAIIPAWAFMFLATKLQPYAKKTVLGNKEQLETAIYQEIIADLDVGPYQDKYVIIKGCSKKPVPANAFLLITTRLQTVVKSLMYGEACSSVPLYKKK